MYLLENLFVMFVGVYKLKELHTHGYKFQNVLLSSWSKAAQSVEPALKTAAKKLHCQLGTV